MGKDQEDSRKAARLRRTCTGELTIYLESGKLLVSGGDANGPFAPKLPPAQTEQVQKGCVLASFA